MNLNWWSVEIHLRYSPYLFIHVLLLWFFKLITLETIKSELDEMWAVVSLIRAHLYKPRFIPVNELCTDLLACAAPHFKEFGCLHPRLRSHYTSAHMPTVFSFLRDPVFMEHILQLVPYCCYSLISRLGFGLNLCSATELNQSKLTHEIFWVYVEDRTNTLLCSTVQNVTLGKKVWFFWSTLITSKQGLTQDHFPILKNYWILQKHSLYYKPF